MPTGGSISEDYSISDARTGVVRVSRLRLTGWGDAPSATKGLMTFSDQGRLWFKYTSASTLLEVFRRPSMLSGDLVANDTAVASGKATLVEGISSGISGTLDIDNGTPGTNPTGDATLDVVVSYGDEDELEQELQGVASMLTAGKWGGEDIRFEALLKRAKRKLDRWIVQNYEVRLRQDDYGRIVLAHIVNQTDFARCHALIAAHMAVSGRSGFVEAAQDKAAQYLNLAQEEFKNINPVFDYERDLQPDNRAQPGVMPIWRA